MNSLAATLVASQPPTRQSYFEILRGFPGPSLELAWRACLDRSECPACYSSPEYFTEPRAIAQRPFAVLARKDGRVAGVLCGDYQGSHVFCGLMSRPQILADGHDDAATVDTLARGLLAETAAAKLLTVYSWFPLERFRRYGFRERVLEGVVVLDLTVGSETLFKQLDKKRRNCIRSAMRQDIEIFSATTLDDVRAFYDVYSAWYLGSPKEIEGEKVPFEVFEHRFRKNHNFRMFLARSGGKVIAGSTLRFLPGGLIEYANNSSLAEHLSLRPNDLLLWRAIEWACEQGFSRFSLGGAHRFLREFGGILTPIYRYRLDRTPFRRHDLRESITDWGRTRLRQMPGPVEKMVRQILGKTPAAARKQASQA